MSRYGAPERWDRARFEAESRGDVPVMERERERDTYEEVDFYSRSRDRTPPAAPREPRRSFVMREEEQFDYRPRRERFYEEEQDPFEGAMVHRPRREERDFEVDIERREVDRESRRSDRPTFYRRQSSLDTYNRRPMPRYGDRVREDTVYMSTDRRRSGREDDFEEYYHEDDRGGYREREVERIRRRRSPSPHEEVFEEREKVVEKEFPRKGKTKMPVRLVNKRAIIQLGYPFEQEGETIIILKALGKEHIDEVIRLSKEMNKAGGGVEEKKTTYIYEKDKSEGGNSEEKVERKTEIKEWDVTSKKSSRSHRSRRRSSHHSRARSHSTGSDHRAVVLEEIGESDNIRAGINALVVSPQPRRRSKSISQEIKILQAKRRSLRLELAESSSSSSSSDGHPSTELIIARERDDTVEVRKEKKAPDPRIIRAMMATLT